MVQKILKIISLKKYFKDKKENEVWLKIPTNLTSKAERDNLMEATMNQLEELIYKNY